MTDNKYRDSLFRQGHIRRGRDSLYLLYENDGGFGYIQKGAGTREPRRYDTTIFCVLNIPRVVARWF